MIGVAVGGSGALEAARATDVRRRMVDPVPIAGETAALRDRGYLLGAAGRAKPTCPLRGPADAFVVARTDPGVRNALDRVVATTR